jgi:hypothetical protein
MLFARCLSAGMRTHCPDALGGVSAYTPEELGAQGEIDENGAVVAVTVTEQPPEAPSRDQLQAQAMRRLKDQGITGDGIQAMLNQLGGEGVRLGQLSDEVLGKLARVGASAETIQRWNAAGAPAAAPAPAPATGVIVRDPANPEAEDPADLGLASEDSDEQDDPDDLPAAWAA